MDMLWWFYTIVLGGAFAQLSMAIAVQWKIRSATGERVYLPKLLWLVFLLVLTIEVWIAVGYYIRTQTAMSVISLLAFLWVPLGIFILGVFLADTTWSGAVPESDAHRFAALRRSFFTVLLLIPVVNFLHEVALGSAGVDADLVFPALIAVGAATGYFVRSTRADSLLAAVMVLLVSAYLLTSYGTVMNG